MTRKCCLCGNRANPQFEFPSDLKLRNRWFAAVENYFDLTKLNDNTRICRNHFEERFVLKCASKYRLHRDAIPFKFDFVDCNTSFDGGVNNPAVRDEVEFDYERPTKLISKKFEDKAVQVETISQSNYVNYRYRCKVLAQKVKRQNEKLLKLEEKNKALKYINQVLEEMDEEMEDNDTMKYFCINMRS